MSGPPSTRALRAASYALPAAVALFALTCQVLGDPATSLLRFDRDGITGGEWWRLLTGNVVHLGWNHLLLNLAGLALIWWLVAPCLSLTRWISTFVVCCLTVTGGLLLWNPELRWYVGLSGTLHGLLLAGLLVSVDKADLMERLLLAGVIVKLGWEQWQGSSAGTEALVGGNVIVDAHLYGAVGGALLGGLYWGIDRHRAGREPAAKSSTS